MPHYPKFLFIPIHRSVLPPGRRTHIRFGEAIPRLSPAQRTMRRIYDLEFMALAAGVMDDIEDFRP
jgi:hypothetical protein